MDPLVTSAIITGGTQTAQTAGGLFGQRKARQFAQNQSNIAWNRQLGLYKAQLAYNDPSAQMQRLKNAGLNPALMYGKSSGGAAGSVQPSTPAYETVKANHDFSMPQMSGMLQNYMDLKVKQAQVDNINANTSETRANEASKLWALKLSKDWDPKYRQHRSAKLYQDLINSAANFDVIFNRGRKAIYEADIARTQATQAHRTMKDKILQESLKSKLQGLNLSMYNESIKQQQFNTFMKEVDKKWHKFMKWWNLIPGINYSEKSYGNYRNFKIK